MYISRISETPCLTVTFEKTGSRFLYLWSPLIYRLREQPSGTCIDRSLWLRPSGPPMFTQNCLYLSLRPDPKRMDHLLFLQVLRHFLDFMFYNVVKLEGSIWRSSLYDTSGVTKYTRLWTDGVSLSNYLLNSPVNFVTNKFYPLYSDFPTECTKVLTLKCVLYSFRFPHRGYLFNRTKGGLFLPPTVILLIWNKKKERRDVDELKRKRLTPSPVSWFRRRCYRSFFQLRFVSSTWV